MIQIIKLDNLTFRGRNKWEENRKLLILIALIFINIEKTHESAHTEKYTQVSVVGDIRETNTYKT